MLNKNANRLTNPRAIAARYRNELKSANFGLHNRFFVLRHFDSQQQLRALSAFIDSTDHLDHLNSFGVNFRITSPGTTLDPRTYIHLSNHNFRRLAHFTDARDNPFIEPWLLRELARFESGEYEPIPVEISGALSWYVDLVLLHQLHISRKNGPGYIAYTPTAEFGRADRQVVTTLGKYLTKYYSQVLDENKIRDVATQYRVLTTPPELHILERTDDIVDAYIRGPESCMAKSHDNFSHIPVHPAAVYGDESDLKLAIVKQGTRVTARTLVWPEKKIHGRCYGDYRAIHQALTTLGYKHGSLQGAKIKKINAHLRGHIVLPYIDSLHAGSLYAHAGHEAVKVHDTHLTIVSTNQSSIRAGETRGYTKLFDVVKCKQCAEAYAPDELLSTLWGKYCRECVDSFVPAYHESLTSKTTVPRGAVYGLTLDGEYITSNLIATGEVIDLDTMLYPLRDGLRTVAERKHATKAANGQYVLPGDLATALVIDLDGVVSSVITRKNQTTMAVIDRDGKRVTVLADREALAYVREHTTMSSSA